MTGLININPQLHEWHHCIFWFFTAALSSLILKSVFSCEWWTYIIMRFQDSPGLNSLLVMVECKRIKALRGLKEKPLNDVLLGIQWLTLSPHSFIFSLCLQCKNLELKLEEDQVFTEYEQVSKKRANCILSTATLPENAERNRFRDVVPYEDNRVELVPNKENNTGYINASHIKVCSWGEG